MTLFSRHFFRGVSALCVAWSALGAEPDFGRDIRPLLSENCFHCHGPDEKARKAKLRLDTREGLFRVKDGVAVVTPGQSDQSELYKRITSKDPDELMPPHKANLSLSPAQIATIKNWIDRGARWVDHWAFEKIKRPELPKTPAGSEPALNPIDRFVFDRLQQEKMAFAPEADLRTLLRRASLDLTGLPPAVLGVERFTVGGTEGIYEGWVDSLLASPAFGERMAWDWLDVARYADSNGYQGDGDRTMWPWRDWVVDAFNRNLPADQFTIWQLAGDQLPDATIEQKLATGFCRNHPINGEGGRIAEENRVDYVMDMAETTGTAWLGLTFNCTRCHDHKFDPLTRKDYYGMFALFNQTPVDGGGGDPQSKPNLELPSPGQTKLLKESETQVEQSLKSLDEFEGKFLEGEKEKVAKLDEKLQKVLKESPRKRNKAQLADLEKAWEKSEPYLEKLRAARQAQERRDSIRGGIPRVMIMQDRAEVRPTFILEKGIYDKPGDKVVASIPARIGSLNLPPVTNRLGLARWLVAPENPLPARVMVNRLWQQFFGIGLVKTSEDFGVQGEKPSHPELLDWLAAEFIESGWDVKHLCRLIVTSRTYRQSSKATPAAYERDPQNRLLGRGARFRMPSWMLRDQALAASGLLVAKVGGPPVKPYQPSGVWEEATFGNRKYAQDHGESLYRRSLYTFWRRIVAPTMFFDIPSRAVCTVKALRTNIPLHALVTLNDTAYVEASRALAQAALRSSQRFDVDKVQFAFERVLGRSPSAEESSILLRSLQRLRSEFSSDAAAAERFTSLGELPVPSGMDRVEVAAMTGVCTAILNMDEALTRQ